MTTLQADRFAGKGGAGFAELVEKRLGKDANRPLTVQDVAAVMELGETKVREWIESGRLPAANLNAGMTVLIDPGRPSAGTRALRPLWRITRDALLSMVKEMEAGV